MTLQHWAEADKARTGGGGLQRHATVETSMLITMANDTSAVDAALAKAKEQAHAGELGRRLQAARKVGDVTCSLMWDNTDDLDLHCEGPTGCHIFWNAKVGTCSGHLDADMNASDKHLTTECVENLYWKKALGSLQDLDRKQPKTH